MAELYRHIDEKEMWEIADSCLINCGTTFHPDIITHAKGFSSTRRQVTELWTGPVVKCLAY